MEGFKAGWTWSKVVISSLRPLGTECSIQGQDGRVGLIRSSLQDESSLGYMRCHQWRWKEVHEFGSTCSKVLELYMIHYSVSYQPQLSHLYLVWVLRSFALHPWSTQLLSQSWPSSSMHGAAHSPSCLTCAQLCLVRPSLMRTELSLVPPSHFRAGLRSPLNIIRLLQLEPNNFYFFPWDHGVGPPNPDILVASHGA